MLMPVCLTDNSPVTDWLDGVGFVIVLNPRIDLAVGFMVVVGYFMLDVLNNDSSF